MFISTFALSCSKYKEVRTPKVNLSFDFNSGHNLFSNNIINSRLNSSVNLI